MRQRLRTSYLRIGLATLVAALSPIAALSDATEEQFPGVGIIRFVAGSCTGVLVGDDQVLTAAHCVKGRNASEVDADNPIVFQTGAYEGRPAHSFDVQSYSSHPLYTSQEETNFLKVPYDLALLRLKLPVPEEVARPLPVAQLSAEDTDFLLATWNTVERANAAARMCQRTAFDEILTINCEVRMGDSGSPVMRWAEHGPEVVAIITNRLNHPLNAYALAAPTASRVGQLRALLPARKGAE